MRITIDTDTISLEEARTITGAVLDAVAASAALRVASKTTLVVKIPRGPRERAKIGGTVRERVLQVLAPGVSASMNELLRATWASRASLYTVLGGMCDDGIARRVGRGNATRWEMLSPAAPGLSDGVTGGADPETE